MNETYEKVTTQFQDYSKSKEYWDVAKGLQAVDNLKTSEYLDVLIDENLSGKKTYEQVEEDIKKYYQNNSFGLSRECEADLSATRISKLLNISDFRLTKDELRYTHKFIFEGVFPDNLKEYIGVFRNKDIRKNEDILNGKSVIYTSYERISDYLDNDFAEEKERIKNENIDNIKHLTKFVSNIWNIHPFFEGNTRTTAAFILRYLRKNGINVNNDLFKDNSVYFRNALVLSSDNETRQAVDYSYLESFFTKLICDISYQLKSFDNQHSDNNVLLQIIITLSGDTLIIVSIYVTELACGNGYVKCMFTGKSNREYGYIKEYYVSRSKNSSLYIAYTYFDNISLFCYYK